MQHLRVPTTVMQFYKKAADEERVPVSDLYTRALQWYMKNRRKINLCYHLTSSANNSYRSLWFKTSTINRAQGMAERDGVSVNSIAFSAIMCFYYYSLPGEQSTENTENFIMRPVK